MNLILLATLLTTISTEAPPPSSASQQEQRLETRRLVDDLHSLKARKLTGIGLIAGGAALPLGVVALTELFSGLFGLAIGGSSGLAEGLAVGLFALGSPFVLLPVLLGALGIGLVLAIVGVVLYGSVRGAHPNLEAELDTANQREQALDRSVTPAAGGAVIFKF